MSDYYVYIISNLSNTTIYIGVTNNLERRLIEHKTKLIPGFSSKYNLSKLVYFNRFTDIDEAINWEKRIKGWTREKKDELICQDNPKWNDLGKYIR